MTSCARPSASWTTASALPLSGVRVKTSSQVSGRPDSAGSAVEIEVPRRALLEPQPVVLGRLLEELRGLLEDVGLLVALGLLLRGARGGGDRLRRRRGRPRRLRRRGDPGGRPARAPAGRPAPAP